MLRSNKRLVNQHGITKIVRQPPMPAAHGQPKTAVRATLRQTVCFFLRAFRLTISRLPPWLVLTFLTPSNGRSVRPAI